MWLKHQNKLSLILQTKIGIRLIKIWKLISKLKNQKEMPHLMAFLNKYMKEQMKTPEEQWWKVIKHLEEQFFLLIGEKLLIKIMKEKIDQVPQMVKNGLMMLRQERLKKLLQKSEVKKLKNGKFRV